MLHRCLCVPLARAAALDPARVLVRHLFVKRQDDGSLFVLNPSVTDDQNTLVVSQVKLLRVRNESRGRQRAFSHRSGTSRAGTQTSKVESS